MNIQDFMPYIILFCPALICAIASRRYNFILGFFSFFSWSYFIYFIISKTPFIQEDFKVACGLDVGADYLFNYIVNPFMTVIKKLFTDLNMPEVVDALSMNYAYLIVFIVLTVILQVISSSIRAHRVRELRMLKRR